MDVVRLEASVCTHSLLNVTTRNHYQTLERELEVVERFFPDLIEVKEYRESFSAVFETFLFQILQTFSRNSDSARLEKKCASMILYTPCILLPTAAHRNQLLLDTYSACCRWVTINRSAYK